MRNRFRLVVAQTRAAPVTWMSLVDSGANNKQPFFVVSLANGMVAIVDCVYADPENNDWTLKNLLLRHAVPTQEPTRPVPLKNSFMPVFPTLRERVFGKEGVPMLNGKPVVGYVVAAGGVDEILLMPVEDERPECCAETGRPSFSPAIIRLQSPERRIIGATTKDGNVVPDPFRRDSVGRGTRHSAGTV